MLLPNWDLQERQLEPTQIATKGYLTSRPRVTTVTFPRLESSYMKKRGRRA